MCLIFPTLSQTKPRKNPRLQYAFNIQVLVVFCNSHWLSHLAAIFIDKRAEWSTVYSRMFWLLLKFNIITLSWNRKHKGFPISTQINGTFAWLAHTGIRIRIRSFQTIIPTTTPPPPITCILLRRQSLMIGLLIEPSNSVGPYHMRHVSNQSPHLVE